MIKLLKGNEQRASLLSMINIFLKILVSLITVPLTIELFGEEMYGIWAAALSIMTFVNFLDAGLTPSILNRLASTYSKNDNEGFKNAYFLGLYVGMIVIVISIIGSFFIKYIDLKIIFNWSDTIDRQQVIVLFRVVLITTGFIIGTSIIENVFFSSQMGEIPRIASIISNIIGLILIICISKIEVSITVLALIIQIPKFGYRFFLMVVARKKLNLDLFLLIPIKKKVLKELFNTSSLFIFIQIFQWIYSSAASILIPKIIGLNEFSDFSVQFMPFNIILTVIATMQPIFWPKLLELYSNGEMVQLEKKIKKLIKVSWLFILIFITIYSILGPIFIKIYSHNTVEFDYFIAVNLFVWLMIQSTIWWFSTFLHGIEDLKFEVFIFGVSSIILVVMSCVLKTKLTIHLYIIIMWMSILLFNLLPMWFRIKKIIKNKIYQGDLG